MRSAMHLLHAEKAGKRHRRWYLSPLSWLVSCALFADFADTLHCYVSSLLFCQRVGRRRGEEDIKVTFALLKFYGFKSLVFIHAD